MSHPQKRSKAKGYELEVSALKALKIIFPDMVRTGSMAYKKAAADLEQIAPGPGWGRMHLVVTRDHRGPMMVHIEAKDLLDLVGPDYFPNISVFVQCKKRARTWIGTLLMELKEATK